MTLGAPTQIVFIIALVLGVLGLLAFFGVMTVPYVSYALPAAFVLLVAAILLPGL